MAKYLAVVFYILLCLTSCNNNCEEALVVNPVFKMEVLEIPTKGVIASLHGEAQIKNNYSNKYSPLGNGDPINENDIIFLEKDSSLRIVFENKSFIERQTKSKELYFTIALKSSGNK